MGKGASLEGLDGLFVTLVSGPLWLLLGLVAAALLALFRRRVSALYGRAQDWIVAAARRRGQEPWFLAYTALAVALFAVIFVLLSWQLGRVVFDVMVRNGSLLEALNAQATDFRSAWFLLLGLVGALAIPLALNRARIQERQTRVQEKGHVTDRIIRAGELLAKTRDVQEEVRKDDNGHPVFEARTRPAIEARLSAIYTLERVAQESVGPGGDGAEHWPIMETMLAYIRQRRGEDEPTWREDTALVARWEEAYRRSTALQALDAGDEEQDALDRKMTEAKVAWLRQPLETRESFLAQLQALPRPSEDVAAATSVLRNRNELQAAVEYDPECRQPIDGVDLDDVSRQDGATAAERIALARRRIARVGDFMEEFPDGSSARPFALAMTPLHRVDLRGAVLRLQSLADANLVGADLSNSNLEGSDATSAFLTGALLEAARLDGARMAGARLFGANLDYASAVKASFTNSDLVGATLRSAMLEGASFHRANMSGAKVFSASLIAAVMDEACLVNADLGAAMLDGANLAYADLRGASFRYASLAGANLASARLGAAPSRGATITQAQLDEAFGDDAAAAQAQALGLSKPDHWPSRLFPNNAAAQEPWEAWKRERGLGE